MARDVVSHSLSSFFVWGGNYLIKLHR